MNGTHKKTRGNILQNLGLLVGSTLITLICLELFLAYPVYYLFISNKQYTFYSRPHSHGIVTPTPVTVFENTPNLKIKRPKKVGIIDAPRYVGATDIQIDKHGFRYSGNLNKQKPPGEIRIFSFGGSTTYGLEVANHLTYPSQLETIINDPKVKVINAGVPGYRTLHSLLLYKTKVREFNPDIITIYAGINDFMGFRSQRWRPQDPSSNAFGAQLLIDRIPFNNLILVYGAAKTYYSFQGYDEHIPIPFFAKLRQSLYKSKPSDSIMAKAISPIWQEEYKTNVSNLIELAKSEGVTTVLLNIASPTFDNPSELVREYADHDIIMRGNWDINHTVLKSVYKINLELAQEKDVSLIDVNKVFDTYNKNYKQKFKFFTDFIHLTEDGHKLVAETIAKPLRKIINSKNK